MESKRRNKLLTFLLWIAVMANIAMTVGYIVEMFNATLQGMALGFGLCSMFTLANVLGTILLIRWNKSGFWLISLSTVLLATVCLCVLKIDPYSAPAIISSIIGLWIILQLRKNGKSAWKQLRSGWDYKHCRHIYQIFTVIEIVLFILTLFTFGKEYKTSQHSEPPQPALQDSINANQVREKDVVVIDSIVTMDSVGQQKSSSTTDTPKEIKRSNNDNKNGSSGEPNNSLSTLDAAIKYLDNHAIWINSEMERYPELRGLNAIIIKSAQSGHSELPSNLTNRSKKLSEIDKLLKEYEEYRRKTVSYKAKRRRIEYSGNPESVNPNDVKRAIKEALDPLLRINREIEQYKKMVSDSIKNATPTFGLG